MKRKVKSKFMVVIMMVALLFQAFTPSTTVFAEGTLHNNVIKSIRLTKADLTTPIQTIGESQQMQLVVDFSLPNNTVKEGDRTVIQIPNELAIYKGETFPIKNTAGEIIANAVVDPDAKTITVTYTKYVEEHSDVSGSLHVTVIVDSRVVKQAQTLHLTVTMGNSTTFNLDFDYTGVTGDSPHEELGKWSYFDKNDPTIVHCRIRVNAKGGNFPYIKVTDTLESDSVSYIKESVEIKKGKWKLPDGGGYYILENETDVTNQYPLTYNGNSFTVQFNNIQGEGYIIKYDVKLGYTPVNQEVIKNRVIGETDNQQFVNTLTIALYQQSGGEANGYNYTIKIHKESEDGTNLSGAKFAVIRNSTQAKVGEITTDGVGDGSLGGLLKDNYTLKEIEAPKGYILDETEIPVTPDDFGTDKTVLKTVKNKPVTTSISVEKKWIGPVKDSVTVHLYADDVDTGNSVSLNALNGWKATFDNLRKFKADGTEIKYTIKEDAVENYKSEITGDMTAGFIVKNTNTEKVSVPVMKQWVGKPTEKVEVKLLADNKEKETATLTADISWKYTFKDLPKYDDKDGHEIVYTVKEVKVDGYITGISGTAKDGFTITNTITGKVSVPVTKKWIGKEGTSATIRLYADGKEVDSVNLNAGNNWQHTFSNLEKYKDGTEIKYTIKEDAVENYKSEITGDMTTGFTVKNTNTEKVSVPVMKQWVGKPTEKVEVKLLADNKEKETATLTADTGWKHTFKDLPKYDDKDGHEIVYTVKEVKVDGYITDISGTAKNGFIITNTITGKVSIPVTKKWIGAPTDSITVNLYADGKKIDSQKLSKDNNWQYIFKNLEQYKDGKEITYTIEEEKVMGYSTSITGDAGNGFVITNTKDKPKLPKTGDSSDVEFFAGLLLLSGTLLTAIGLKRRKEVR
ncbi:MAG: Cna B-type domain-containing protein [Peptostreptococcaceae bacterium]|nr:Cna B-type domain-containing protein [Peptostreptococcaceae bacterium]